ncbi:MAG: sodium:solute symporter family protein [Sumerlaeia bacterium]
MSPLLFFVILYIVVTVGIGLYASMRVKTSTDFVLAGRSLPIYVTIATVFATWFGSEAVLGVSGTFAAEGGNLGEIIADPFGAGLCLIFVGLFFAGPLYRLKLTTIADFYNKRYSRTVEVLISIAICISYLGWVAAQVIALGVVINEVSNQAISIELGMFIGIASVLIYTVFGGMISVAVTDFVQMAVIIIGVIVVAFMISGRVEGGASAVIEYAAEKDKFKFFPEFSAIPLLAFFGSFITLALGSIPQQDVFQRVMSAKSEKSAVWGTVIGGTFYMIFCFIPVFIAVAATMIDPSYLEADNGENIIPNFVIKEMPVFIQIIFFGALLSAIMSTASGTLLAPSAIFAENILKETFNLNEKSLLLTLRLCVLGFGAIVFLYAYFSESQGLTIFEMVENAYLVTLCGAFVPLAFGVYWKRATNTGALTSIALGVTSWVIFEVYNLSVEETQIFPIPANVIGLFMAIVGMIVGSLISPAEPEKHLT